jgi:hypothetical protein
MNVDRERFLHLWIHRQRARFLAQITGGKDGRFDKRKKETAYAMA